MKNIKVHWLEYFDYYENDPTMVSRLSLEELETIVGRILFNKRNLLPHIKQMRVDCQKELEHRRANIKKRESAQVKKEVLYDRISIQYDVVEKYWKSIENGPEHRRDLKVKDYRRSIGQRMYDHPKLHTGYWSSQAYINFCNGKHHLNTEEHYYSLHATAGRRILQEALAKGIKYNIHDFARAVYAYTHVNWTTKEENIVLGKYHGANEMVSPEDSYKACGIGPLIYIPNEPTVMALAWRYLLEDLGVDYRKITPPFTNVISLKTAEEWYPDIKQTPTQNELINTPVVENMTVEATLEEK